ncbi:RdgB/HAM1 family non-canonical purine NTP pyrophosphatase [Microcella daejeonensis]|uniref:RdgB/HAM1 family non-canonical purine NTP pyrophosphatase n=1 Tax=Microcella daejeonensis TaxID=2994971 RepID=UPI002270D628|nr:RdgB/HAM1 family non-canonical purine NTP pyrophosphatase [Microcella daejeonensis]WAB83798.1 RdgB/HAM1 family non-canonical purine NTP pyrophosphatase [Microcella daejeonensis]
MRVVVATHNAHKVAELQRILGAAVPELELVAYDGPAPEEDGDTFAANALIKARAAAERTGLPAIADDSGISVDALGGAPGIHSAYYSGHRDDAANVRHLLEQLAAQGEGADRAAQFTCAAALVDPGEIVDGAPFETVELGVWPGSVAAEAAGGGGFGYDPVFVPEGLEVTAAEISAEEKNATSHRARAFAALAAVLRARAEG